MPDHRYQEHQDLMRRATRGLSPTADQYATIDMALESARSIYVQVGSEYSRAMSDGMLWGVGDPEDLKRSVAQNLIPTIVPYIPTGNTLLETAPGWWRVDMEDLADRIRSLLAVHLEQQEQR